MIQQVYGYFVWVLAVILAIEIFNTIFFLSQEKWSQFIEHALILFCARLVWSYLISSMDVEPFFVPKIATIVCLYVNMFTIYFKPSTRIQCLKHVGLVTLGIISMVGGVIAFAYLEEKFTVSIMLKQAFLLAFIGIALFFIIRRLVEMVVYKILAEMD